MGSRAPKDIKNELDTWKYYHGKGHRHAIRRGKLRKKFENMFPKGKDMESLLVSARQRVAEGKGFTPQTKGQYLESVHPDAFRFLLRHGKEYKPLRWDKAAVGQPRRKSCFLNAYSIVDVTHQIVMRKKNASLSVKQNTLAVYVEGIACGPLVWPMLHGWNSKGMRGDTAFDWTFYTVNNRTKYFGIPLEKDEYQRLCKCTNPRRTVISVFHREMFSVRVKVNLQKILLERKRKKKKVPKRAARKRGSFLFRPLFGFGGDGFEMRCGTQEFLLQCWIDREVV